MRLLGLGKAYIIQLVPIPHGVFLALLDDGRVFQTQGAFDQESPFVPGTSPGEFSFKGWKEVKLP